MGEDRNKEIHEKGFRFGRETDFKVYGTSSAETQYRKIKVGVKNLEDAVLNLGELKKAMPNHKYLSKRTIYKALAENDITELRNISNFYYNLNGIYKRACDHVAFLYRYDWYITPQIYDKEAKEEKLLKEFNRVLTFLDSSQIRKTCGDIALSVIKEGAYYGYIVPSKDGLCLQQLPVEYCRSRYSVKNRPAIEFNMRFFDQFSDYNYRMRILKLFPEEFKKGYSLYLKGKLLPDYAGDTHFGWYLLDPESTIKFSINNNDIPMFVNSIPSLLDLDAAQDLDRRKQMQKLLKIIVQKLPLDKNGDLIFDVDEAADIHANAVEMLSRAVGVDVLTTFADIESIDMSDKNTTTSKDDLEKVERAVFNSMGLSKNLFNTDGNLSLEKSILSDESAVRNLLLQFADFYDHVTKMISSNNKKYTFRLYMLETTQYNYKELSKMYKEQTQLGYSKMLPQIALGHSQSFILNTVQFENEILHLSDIMIPPMQSSTMNAEALSGLGGKNKTSNQDQQNKSGNTNQQKVVKTEEKQTGRPQKAEGEKSTKTIQNNESMN